MQLQIVKTNLVPAIPSECIQTPVSSAAWMFFIDGWHVVAALGYATCKADDVFQPRILAAWPGDPVPGGREGAPQKSLAPQISGQAHSTSLKSIYIVHTPVPTDFVVKKKVDAPCNDVKLQLTPSRRSLAVAVQTRSQLCAPSRFSHRRFLFLPVASLLPKSKSSARHKCDARGLS
jgi:hypothetical protein